MIELVNEVDVTLVSAHASDDMVAMAAWVSHDADSEDRLNDQAKVKGLINFLYREKHMSPFEHGSFTFKVDVPLFVAREFMRHRTASYNEVSGRYTEMKPRFYVGEVARIQEGKPGAYYFKPGNNEQTAIYLASKRQACDDAWIQYQRRLDAGIAKEQAREDLPLSLMTQFYVTMNPRNLMQFLTLRNAPNALKEIQDVAVKMESYFKQFMPFTYDAYVAGRVVVDVKALKSRINNLEDMVKRQEEERKELNKKAKELAAERDAIRIEFEEYKREAKPAIDAYNADYVKKNDYSISISDLAAGIDPNRIAEIVAQELKKRGIGR